VISAGSGAADFEPRHTTHGFQYVGIDGAEDLTVDDVTGVMVHTDMVRTGWFRCSDNRINALHEAVVLGFRGNACEVPTDCPQRERAGWTGDWQLFVPTAAFLYDVAGFSDRWLRDLAADQWDDGRVSNYVPEPHGPEASEWTSWITGSAGWGDAAIYVPFQIWQSYGDVDLLARQYPSMQRWIDLALQRASELRHPARVEARPEPAPHERFLWDHGFHWGEWCEPDSPAAGMETFGANPDFGEIGTAYLQRSLATLAEIAALIGHDDDSARYRGLATDVRDAWQTEYVSEDGEVTPAKQANLVRALAFDLVEPEHRARVAEDLVALIRAADTHLGTGFLATPFLLPTLADSGHLDVAYELLFQKTPPSWLYMIDQGATTIWENWEGLDKDGGGSLNHYSKGAVISFLHEYVAGIRPIRGVPAYREFEVRPMPGGGITSAEARLDTPYGPISSSWRAHNDSFELEVTVAPGTQAAVTLPDGTITNVGPGTHRLHSR
jgi:alpha-L-rhamnosidase